MEEKRKKSRRKGKGKRQPPLIFANEDGEEKGEGKEVKKK